MTIVPIYAPANIVAIPITEKYAAIPAIAIDVVNFQQPLDFDYTMYSKAAIRLVLDALHLIQVEEVDLLVLIEALDYLHFEGKTELSHFEKELATNLMETLTKMKLSISTKILLCLVISTMDNYDSSFEKMVGATMTEVLY